MALLGTLIMTPKMSDAEKLVCGLLARYNCPLQFHEVRACFMGAIACPAMGINPTRVIGGMWGGHLPEFMTLADADNFFDVLINQCWNSLTAHQDRRNIFELTKWTTKRTKKDLAAFSNTRTEELAIFIEAIEGPDDELKLPQRAIRAVRVLEEVYALISGVQALALDKRISKNTDEIDEIFKELDQLTLIAEKEINAAIIACHKSRKTNILHLPKAKDRIH